MTITEEAIRFIWGQVDKLFVRKADVQQEVNSSTNPVSSVAVKTIVDKLSGTPIVPKGSIEFSNLPTLTDASIGDLYNIKDNFTTTEDFIEGAGAKISAGTNVVCVEENLTKKWDCFGTNFEVDNEPTQNSNNPISSNAVYSLKQIVDGLSGGTTITHKGEVSDIDKLPALTDCEVGDIYTIAKTTWSSDGVAGWTTNAFVEGADQIFPKNARVICVEKDGEKKWTRIDTAPDVVEYVDNHTSLASPTGEAVYEAINTASTTLINKINELSSSIINGYFPIHTNVDSSKLYNLTDVGYYPNLSIFRDVNPDTDFPAGAIECNMCSMLVFEVNDDIDSEWTGGGRSFIYQVLFWDYDGEAATGPVPEIPTEDRFCAYRRLIKPKKAGATITPTEWVVLGEKARQLYTPRNIAGTSFDGTADIDISYNNLTDKPTIPTVSNDLTDELKTQYDTAATNSHTHSNKEVLDKTTAAFTEELKAKVETPYLPKAGGAMTGTILSQANNCLVSQFGDYKVFFRNNGTDRFYVLLSDKGGDTWNNDKHPFTINLETGEGYINGSAATLKDSGWIDMEVNSDFVSSGTIKYRTYGKQLMIYGENVVLAQELKISPSAPQMLASTTGIDFSNIKCCSGFGRTGGGHGAHIHALQYRDGTNMISAEAVATACPVGENLYFTITGLID